MRSRLSLTAVFTVLGSGLLLAGWMLADARQAAWTRAASASSTVAQALEYDIEHSLDGYDQALQVLADGLRLPDLRLLGPDAQRAVLLGRAAQDRYLDGLVATDGAGVVTFSSTSRVPVGSKLGDRDFVQARLGGGDGLYVGQPFRSRMNGEDAVGLSRRLAAPDGSAAGVVAATLHLGYFRDLFERVRRPEPGSTAVVMRTDGTLLMRVPPVSSSSPGRSGPELAGATRFPDLSSLAGGSYEARSRFDGAWRLYSYRRVGALPLVVVVGTTLDQVYAEWRQHALMAALVGLPLLAAALLLGWTLLEELDRRGAAERAASERGAEFRATFDHSADGLFLLRITAPNRFVLERANAVLARHWGLPLLAMERREPRSFLPAPLLAQMEAGWRACAGSGEPGRYLLTIEQAGRRQELETVLTPVRDSAGRVALLLGSARDVTERIEVARQLERAQRVEAVAQMTAGVAHDFNNLLQTITIGVRDLLARSPDGGARERLGAALRAVDRGAELTRRLLRFSRQDAAAEAGADAGLLDVVALLGGLRELLGWSLGGRVQVQMLVEPAPWPVRADAAQLEMCLLNLAINARDAMPNGGWLTVRVRNAAAAEAAEAGLPAVDHLVVSVQDEGSGMDAATRARVFEAFFTTKGTRGSGLGLWMVRGFTQRAGGDVRIESEPGQGTQVALWLPRAADALPVPAQPVPPQPALAQPAAEPRPPARPSPPRQEGGRILLADDDQLVRRALARLLTEAGYEVVPVASAADALLLLSTPERFHLLIADQNMPGLPGTGLVAEAARRRPGLPAVVITGYARLDEPPPGVRVLHKPIDADALLREVSALIAPAAEAVGA